MTPYEIEKFATIIVMHYLEKLYYEIAEQAISQLNSYVKSLIKKGFDRKQIEEKLDELILPNGDINQAFLNEFGIDEDI